MRYSQFVPKISKSLDVVKHYSHDDQCLQASDLLYKTFKGEENQVYKQVDWMGRWCFLEIEDRKSYIIGKWVGPWVWSELMRVFLADVRNNDAGQERLWWCIRIDTNTYYPFLVQFIETEDGYEIIDPRPEWFSIFWALYREAESAVIYERNNINILKPISLFHNKLDFPWKEQWFDQYIKEKFKEIFMKEYQGEISKWKIENISLKKAAYFDLDWWVLVRNADTPFRISNLQTLATKNDAEWFDDILAHIDGYLEEHAEKIETYIGSLWTAAGILFRKWIIHGQFKTHFQNISVLWEIGDFDSSIFLGAFSGFNKLWIEVTEQDRELYEKYIESIKNGEKSYTLDMMSFIYDDLKLFSGGKDINSVSPAILAMNMLGQIYDLFVQWLRLYDLYARKNNSIINNPWTVLKEEEMIFIKTLFIKNFLKEIEGNIKTEDLLKWVIKNWIAPVKEKYLNRMDRSTIYWWHMQGIPMDYINIDCNKERQNFIINDFNSFISCIHGSKS